MTTFRKTALASLVAILAIPATAAEIRTDNRLQITSDDGQFSVRLRGRLHADANFYNNDVVDHTSGAYIRRARIGVEGHFQNWKYEVTFDNASHEADLKDAMVSTKLGAGTLIIGQAKIFEGLEQLTSSNDITLMERSHVGNLVAGRQIGLQYRGASESVGYGFGGYSLSEAADGGGTRASTNGWGTAGRLYFAPVNDGTNAVHLGVSYAYERTGSEGERGRVRPAGRSNDGRFVVFDRRDENMDQTRLNLEAAAVMGNFMMQAEYLMGEASDDVRPDDEFTAWYVQASYAIGAPRRYDIGSGRLRAPGAAGTWEVAVRYQEAERDLTSEKLTGLDFGVTYYAHANIRFMANYTTILDNDQNDEPDVLAVRAQWAF